MTRHSAQTLEAGPGKAARNGAHVLSSSSPAGNEAVAPPPEAIRPALDRAARLAQELNLSHLRPQIEAARRLLAAPDQIDVAVFGRFKAGKSSFLNCLVGRDVLPIGAAPLTAVVTRLRHGPVERAVVRRLDGTSVEIPIDEIRAYVAEAENPGNKKGAAFVDVELPALQPLAPLQFVDTPGLDSAFAHNTEATRAWLPNVGAALLAVSADAPLSEQDLALLEELRRHTPRIVLILTKIDLLTEAQRAEVLAFVSDQLAKRLGDPAPVFPYSVRPGFEGYRQDLLDRFLLPLVKNRARAGSDIARHKVDSLLQALLDYVRVAVAAAEQAESAREALRRRLEEERNRLEALSEELCVMSYRWAGQALERSLERLRPDQRALQEKIVRELRAQFSKWRMRAPQFVRAYGRWLRERLVEELGALSDRRREVFCEPLEKSRDYLARVVEAFQDRLARSVKEALGVEMGRREFVPQLREPQAPPVDVSTEFMIPMELAGHLIPMTLFRKAIEKNLLRRARYEVEKNLSRLAADWRARIRPAMEELNRQALEYAQSELEAIQRMASQQKSALPQLQETVAELEALRLDLRPSAATKGDERTGFRGAG